MAMNQTLFDISPAITPTIPVWPGDTQMQQDFIASIGPQCPVNIGRLTLSTHTGAHADGPLHYHPDGQPIGQVPLDVYIGRCRVVHCLDARGAIGPEQIAPYLDDCPPRLLIRTYRQAPQAAWDSDFCAIGADTIELLAARGIRLIGVDTPSLDPETSKTMEAHHAVYRHDLAILEGLVLDAIAPGDYELIALPLKLTTLDASPVRAILRSL